jgi:VWFA-related protein
MPMPCAMAMLSHRRGWSFAVIAFAFSFVFIAGAADDPPAFTYRTAASEVRVAFFATDENNHLVDQVNKNDFAVVDGGMVIRDFRSLNHSNETALDIVAVVDASDSVASRLRTAMNGVLHMTSEQTAGADDSLSVVSFSGLRSVLLCSQDCASAAAEQRLEAVKAAGPTPLFDALIYAADFSSSHRTPGSRQVVILFSDGNDTVSMSSASDALKAITASGAVLYAVDLNESDASNGSAWLRSMAEATGGRYFSSKQGDVNVLQAAFADLRASFVVTYSLPTRVVGFHSLRILPKHNLNLRFHCRSGYNYEEHIP